MAALTVLLIRHGEKPEPDRPEWGPGLTMAGHEDKQSLVVRGWQRAGALAALFGSGMNEDEFPRPDAVYAADPNKQPVGDDTISQRPWETVLPLCQRLDLSPVTKHGVGDEEDLVANVKQHTGIVLISWEHKKIVDAILPELAPGVPALPLAVYKSNPSAPLMATRTARLPASGGWLTSRVQPPPCRPAGRSTRTRSHQICAAAGRDRGRVVVENEPEFADVQTLKVVDLEACDARDATSGVNTSRSKGRFSGDGLSSADAAPLI